MEPQVYNEYTRLVKEAISGKGDIKDVDSKFFDNGDTNEVNLTIKNYSINGGLSETIHNSPSEKTFIIKGPMGKGLSI
jgi:hypothetical protein